MTKEKAIVSLKNWPSVFKKDDLREICSTFGTIKSMACSMTDNSFASIKFLNQW